jgi:hypothetical protein
MEEIPFPSLEVSAGPDALPQWLVRFHNRVNKKLRDQYFAGELNGLPAPPADPSYEDVKEKYTKLLSGKPNVLPGQDFLSAILYNYDLSKKDAYTTFFNTLVLIFPFKQFRGALAAYVKEHPLALRNQKVLVRWGHGLLRALCSVGGVTCSYASVRSMCMTCAHYKSKCAKKTYRGKTCRAVRKAGKLTRVKQRDPARVRAFVQGRLLST